MKIFMAIQKDIEIKKSEEILQINTFKSLRKTLFEKTRFRIEQN